MSSDLCNHQVSRLNHTINSVCIYNFIQTTGSLILAYIFVYNESMNPKTANISYNLH